MVAGWNPFFLGTGFTSSTFLIQPDFSQNQPATITPNTGSPRTLVQGDFWAKVSQTPSVSKSSCDLSVFLYVLDEYSIDSSKTTSKFP